MYSYKYKNTVVAILLACILTMAIGYAALQQRLNISGTSSISSVYDVRFTNIKSTPSNENVTDKVAPSYTNTTATFSTNLTSPGDTMTYDITVSNLGTLDAKLILVTMSDSNNPAIDFTYEGVKAGDVLKSQESTVVKVTVKYSDTVTTQPDSISSDLTIKLDYSQIGVMTQEEIVSSGGYLMEAEVSPWIEEVWLDGPFPRSKIETIDFATTNVVPVEAGENYWDVSNNQDGSILAWYVDSDSDGLYEVTVGQEGGVVANPNSSYLFSGFYAIDSVNLENLNTSIVTDMSYMFDSSHGFTSIDASSLDTSNVTTMKSMFSAIDFDGEAGYEVSSSLRNVDVSGWDTSKVTDMSYMFAYTWIEELDISHFKTSNVNNMKYMFAQVQAPQLDVSNWDTSNVTNMAGMFSDVYNVETLDLSNFNTSKVTDMSEMFSLAKSLKSLNLEGWDTSKVTDMSSMFSSMLAIEEIDIDHFNTSNVTDMSWMFSNMRNLKELNIKNFDTRKVTDMSWMFYHVKKVESLDLTNFITSNVITMSDMFNNMNALTDLKINSFNTSKVENMDGMFSYLSSMKDLNIKNFDTSNVTNMYEMFDYSTSIIELDISNFNTSKVTDMSRMFESCTNLKTIYVSDLFVTTAVEYGSNMFYNSENLVGQSGKTYSYDTRGYEYANYETGYFTYKAYP